MQISEDSKQRRDTSLEINKPVYVTRSQQKRCKYFASLPTDNGERSTAKRQKEDRLSAVLFCGTGQHYRCHLPALQMRSKASCHLHIVIFYQTISVIFHATQSPFAVSCLESFSNIGYVAELYKERNLMTKHRK